MLFLQCPASCLTIIANSFLHVCCLKWKERKTFVQEEIVSALTYKAFYDHMATIPTDFLQMPCYLQENKLYWLDIDWQN